MGIFVLGNVKVVLYVSLCNLMIKYLLPTVIIFILLIIFKLFKPRCYVHSVIGLEQRANVLVKRLRFLFIFFYCVESCYLFSVLVVLNKI